jgi:tetratricopeptide (TPR) repeat protein
MGVLIEAVNVVIRNATVEARLAGGMQEYERRCPNGTFCTDGEICRVGFMTTADAASYIESLESLGFRRPTPEGSLEVALISQAVGFDHPCDWLELSQIDLGDGQSAEVAWLRGTTPSKLVAPPQWKPGRTRQVPRGQLRDYEYLGSKEGVDIFLDKATGELLYVGRTQEGVPPAHVSRAAIGDRFTSLADELTRLGAFEGTSARDYRGQLAALHQRAKQLVEDTQASEAGPLQLQGIAARLLMQWNEAATLFRRVTEMRPEYVDGWLELTWSLASLRRFEEAERAARKAVELVPDRADALGNLAAVLLEQGRLDEARQMAEKALAADPADAKNRAVLAAIKRTAAKGSPWWRRLFGRVAPASM